MKRVIIPALILVVCLCSGLGTAEDAWLFEAGKETPAATLTNKDQCTETEFGGQRYVELPPETDPYQGNAYTIQCSAAALTPGKEQTLEIAFYDKGAGVIRPSIENHGVKVPSSRQQSFTRLNTLRARSAFFSLQAPAQGWNSGELATLVITGLDHLRGIRILPAFAEDQWKTVRNGLPKDVTPMVALNRPMDLVTTAGVSALLEEHHIDEELRTLEEYVPLAKVLGFNGIELYVRWNLIEPEREGVFDFSYYDALVNKMQEYGMKWFPLLVVGSAYALPEWFYNSPDNVGFVCLEHGMDNPIQSIWSPYHQRHVTRVLQAFGEHYDKGGSLLGVRLGPSGNFGESQYPAGGNWPLKGRKMHIHIGYWSGDAYAKKDFQAKMATKYGTIEALNAAWESKLSSFDAIPMQLPVSMLSKRQRADFGEWYTQCMSDWCGWWAQEAAKAMPSTKIYQSAGGWGFLEAGTSYTEQAASMKAIHGGIRLTNETDSFEQDFDVTRLAATAARLYGIDLGYEPASSHTARGVAGRIFNTATTNGDHLFTYHPNVMFQPMAIEQWLKYIPELDRRDDPIIDVAVYYPETMNQLDDSTFRHLYATGFYPRAQAIRRVIDLDYLDDNLIREGYLDRYKVLVFVWGENTEKAVLDVVDQWMQRGGRVIYPSFPRGPLATVEGDTSICAGWEAGKTGQGAFLRFKGDMEPPSFYGEFAAEQLGKMENLHPWTRAALATPKPEYVYLSVLQNGEALALNYSSKPQTLQIPGAETCEIPPYGVGHTAMPR